MYLSTDVNNEKKRLIVRYWRILQIVICVIWKKTIQTLQNFIF